MLDIRSVSRLGSGISFACNYVDFELHFTYNCVGLQASSYIHLCSALNFILHRITLGFGLDLVKLSPKPSHMRRSIMEICALNFLLILKWHKMIFTVGRSGRVFGPVTKLTIEKPVLLNCGRIGSELNV